MTFDSTITISIILALCALFAPSITAIINNKHQYKMRNLELQYDLQKCMTDIEYKNKYDIYKAFIDEVGRYNASSISNGNIDAAMFQTQKVILVCDSKTRELLKEFQRKLLLHSPGSDSSYNEFFSNIVDSFNRELSLLSYTQNN